MSPRIVLSSLLSTLLSPPLGASDPSRPGPSVSAPRVSATLPRALFPGALFPSTLFPGALFPGSLFPSSLFSGALFPSSLFTGLLFAGLLFTGLLLPSLTPQALAAPTSSPRALLEALPAPLELLGAGAAAAAPAAPALSCEEAAEAALAEAPSLAAALQGPPPSEERALLDGLDGAPSLRGRINPLESPDGGRVSLRLPLPLGRSAAAALRFAHATRRSAQRQSEALTLAARAKRAHLEARARHAEYQLEVIAAALAEAQLAAGARLVEGGLQLRRSLEALELRRHLAVSAREAAAERAQVAAERLRQYAGSASARGSCVPETRPPPAQPSPAVRARRAAADAEEASAALREAWGPSQLALTWDEMQGEFRALIGLHFKLPWPDPEAERRRLDAALLRSSAMRVEQAERAEDQLRARSYRAAERHRARLLTAPISRGAWPQSAEGVRQRAELLLEWRRALLRASYAVELAYLDWRAPL